MAYLRLLGGKSSQMANDFNDIRGAFEVIESKIPPFCARPG